MTICAPLMKSPNCAFPDDERLRCGDRIAVLESERRVLGERGVVRLERRGRRRLRCLIGACWAPVCASWRTRWRWENVPRSVSWPVRRIGMPSTSRLANASDSAWPQSIPPASSAADTPLEHLHELRIHGEPLGDADELRWSSRSRSAGTPGLDRKPRQRSACSLRSMPRAATSEDFRASCAARMRSCISFTRRSASSAGTSPDSARRFAYERAARSAGPRFARPSAAG